MGHEARDKYTTQINGFLKSQWQTLYDCIECPECWLETQFALNYFESWP